MACVILPSETARLVYGYLVKENLNEIALQFLENSPYLTDCCQIVKSGFQFNTKLMNKDLQELLQEYSIIHNLVNNKVSLLCKTSVLYKRIKLQCDSLPEILELILFWKYKNFKNDNLSKMDKNEKITFAQVAGNNFELTKMSDVSNKSAGSISDVLENCCYSENEKNLSYSSETKTTDKVNSKSCHETYLSNKNFENELPNHNLSPGINNVQRESSKETVFISVPVSDIVESCESDKSNNINSFNDNSNNNMINKINSPESQVNNNMNVLTINLNPSKENEVIDEISNSALDLNNDVNEYENQIKIVGIEEKNENQNHAFDVYAKSVENESNVNLENSSVLFVGSEVGNVTIDQERNQIIVIPIDYYKTQDNLQNEMEITDNEKLDITQGKETVNNKNNEIVFEGITNVATETASQLYGVKSPLVDESIITEKDFLKNNHLMLKMEKELNKSEKQVPPPTPLQDTTENISLHSVTGPLIVVSQTVVPSKPSRYRTILPKTEETVQVEPVFVVQPLLEKNKDSVKPKSLEMKTKPETKIEREVNRKIKKKNPSSQKPKIKVNENAEEFSKEDLPMENAAAEANPEVNVIPADSNKEQIKEMDIERTSEEKENCEKIGNKKTVTPVFVARRNSKRLSLSTPRRRNHIRALEFETPPKKSEDRKKSKTSPKIKVDQMNLERKSVRNTLFKSPENENTIKSQAVCKEGEKITLQTDLKTSDIVESLNELSIPIATRSPNTKLSDAWENLTGVGCVIGQAEGTKTSVKKKMWDADLRCFISENNVEQQSLEKKKIKKPEKSVKDSRKTSKKKSGSAKKIKPLPITVSPSKISLTAKRNTYSINGSEEGSPIRSLLDDLKLVTPFKDVETIRPTEETPLTKLLRENINSIDIDLSMINTPSFPPTPSIVITPDLEDVSISGTNYYSPSKENSKEKVLKITDYFSLDPEKSNLKKESKEMHEKVIDDLVLKAKEIIGMGREGQEENLMKGRPSGKILSMVKIQMLTQCDKKLCENIPINEEVNFPKTLTNQMTLIGNSPEDTSRKNDIKDELEEKRKRALKKIKVVKENLSQIKNKVTKRGRKRKRSLNLMRFDKPLRTNETIEEKQTSESDESFKTEGEIFHSTPNSEEKMAMPGKDLERKIDSRILQEIRQKFPPFLDNPEKHPELNEKSRKKIHYVESFIKLAEIVKYISEYDEKNPPKLFLKPSLRRFYQVFYKWLKHPHKRELNSSPETKAMLKEYLLIFDKINKGLIRKIKKDSAIPSIPVELSSSDLHNKSEQKPFSDDEEREWKKREIEKRKDEEAEDGVVSTLPLKKRKSTVQQVELQAAITKEKIDTKNNCSENVSQTQNFLQDIDVDRFLSQIHGQENQVA